MRLRITTLLTIFILCIWTDHALAQERSNYFKSILEDAQKGDVNAMYRLAGAYQYGNGTEVDFGEALYWYKRVEKEGHTGVAGNIGDFYFFGHGVQQNIEEAIKWWLKATNDISNNTNNILAAHSMFRLGRLYTKGDNVPMDLKKGIEWYEKAANNGSTAAMYDLGLLYFTNEEIKNIGKGKAWLMKAIDIGSTSAMTLLGIFYVNSENKSDHEEAFRLLGIAAEEGEDTAMQTLGTMYYSGLGTEKDKLEGLYWYARAAMKGNEMAREFLTQ